MKSMSMESFWERRLLSATLALVVFIGLPIGLDILSTSEESEVRQTPSIGSRQPSSIAIAEGSGIMAKSTSLYQFDCDQIAPDAIKTEGGFLRIKGSFCSEETHTLQVVNQTNGFTADLIRISDKDFTTDFMELSEGSNVIKLSYKDKNGGLNTREIKVERRSPASVNF